MRDLLHQYPKENVENDKKAVNLCTCRKSCAINVKDVSSKSTHPYAKVEGQRKEPVSFDKESISVDWKVLRLIMNEPAMVDYINGKTSKSTTQIVLFRSTSFANIFFKSTVVQSSTYARSTTPVFHLAESKVTQALSFAQSTTPLFFLTEPKVTQALTFAKSTTPVFNFVLPKFTQALTFVKSTTPAFKSANYKVTQAMTFAKSPTPAFKSTNSKVTQAISFAKSTTPAFKSANYKVTRAITFVKSTIPFYFPKPMVTPALRFTKSMTEFKFNESALKPELNDSRLRKLPEPGKLSEHEMAKEIKVVCETKVLLISSAAHFKPTYLVPNELLLPFYILFVFFSFTS